MRNAELPEITHAEQIVSMPALQHRRWTEEEVRQLIEDAPGPTPRYELVDGELLVTPSPNRVHQRIVFELALRLRDFVNGNRLGEVCISPGDVRLAPGLVLQPDFFVAPPVNGKRPRGSAPVTTLTLAVEVISPSSARFDRVTKRRAYQRAGVPEYWIVDGDARTIDRWQPNDVRPDICDATLTWNADGAEAPFVLDVRQFFVDVSDEPIP